MSSVKVKQQESFICTPNLRQLLFVETISACQPHLPLKFVVASFTPFSDLRRKYIVPLHQAYVSFQTIQPFQHPPAYYNAGHEFTSNLPVAVGMASSSEIDMPKTGRTNSTITIFFLNPEGEDHWYLSPRVMNSFKAGGIPWKSSMQ